MELLAMRSERAISAAARELGVDPLALATSLQDGRLAQCILELRLAEFEAVGPRRERIGRLLSALPLAAGTASAAHEDRG